MPKTLLCVLLLVDNALLKLAILTHPRLLESFDDQQAIDIFCIRRVGQVRRCSVAGAYLILLLPFPSFFNPQERLSSIVAIGSPLVMWSASVFVAGVIYVREAHGSHFERAASEY